MRETKPDDLSRNDAAPLEGPRNERRHSTRSNAALKPAAVARAPASSLPALKALISSHKTLLATVRRSNELLAIDNTRMERELEVQAQLEPTSDTPPQAAAVARDDRVKLVWVKNYINGTLAQTLWALTARAELFDEQVTSSAQHQQATRLLEMSHVAYDQLRDLMDWLELNTDE